MSGKAHLHAAPFALATCAPAPAAVFQFVAVFQFFFPKTICPDLPNLGLPMAVFQFFFSKTTCPDLPNLRSPMAVLEFFFKFIYN